jgi:hypothetical protein
LGRDLGCFFLALVERKKYSRVVDGLARGDGLGLAKITFRLHPGGHHHCLCVAPPRKN